ncbi:MAG: N-acetylneuraminate synthase family protein [Phycisphaerales bacterium]|nr:N-acetylneuraminate synthase family protein [Phycisphaerales bacterium]
MSPSILVNDRRIGFEEPPYVIAEVGVNHDGSMDRAIDLVHAAAAAGADAVKFQWFSAERLVVPGAATAEYQKSATSGDQRTMLAELELGCREMSRLVDVAHAAGIHALVTVFCESLVDEAAQLGWDAWKCASPDLVHRPLLDRLAADGRPLLLSTGAATLEEVERTNHWLHESAVAFLQCVSAYPVPESEAGLGGIEALCLATGRPCGYSDHTSQETTGGLAVAAGALILEKHVTHDRAADGPDHAASMEPEGFARYVEFAHRAHAAIGCRGGKSPREVEAEVRAVARQSLRASRPLPEGTVLSEGDLVAMRPAEGLEPWRLEELMGRTLNRSLDAEEAITREDVA